MILAAVKTSVARELEFMADGQNIFPAGANNLAQVAGLKR